MDFPESIETDMDRIDFLKAIGQLAYYKARIKLNLKRLYSADGYSIRELLKLARILKNGVVSANHQERMNASAGSSEDIIQQAQSEQFLSYITTIRDTSEELTELGSTLDESLEKELKLRDARAEVISQAHDPDTVKETVESNHQKSIEMVKTLREGIDQMKDDEAKLTKQKKRLETELESSKNRLNRNKYVRPQFMDQYDARVKELQVLYTTYVDRYRNLKYLENELEKYRLAEEEIMEENNRELAYMRKKLHEEEIRYMRGEQFNAELDEKVEPVAAQPQAVQQPQEQEQAVAMARPRAASGRRGMSSQGSRPPVNSQQRQPSRMAPVAMTAASGSSMFDKPEGESSDEESEYSTEDDMSESDGSVYSEDGSETRSDFTEESGSSEDL
eukprot:CAMPEP_0117423704 /NCGR_PEP_ID=MMETSP0758-20121206/4267_1 /TAXON_ID=63605 /ORGANISM="Percolomonas cosmopolitus, Strain AE-1 (ATCC 50343)" /LENGTH=389 /DNA_ID=CAMNT_0005207037 /DNA_START=342 /DNA_END=1511 /DNA_ORIENTATION=-